MFKRLRSKITAVALALAVTIPGSGSAYAITQPTINYTQIEGTMLYASGETMKDYSVQVLAYQKVPYNILKKLVEKDCKIYLFTTNENGGNDLPGEVFASACGHFIPGTFSVKKSDPRKIVAINEKNYIEVLSDYDNELGGGVTVHEIGHFVDNNAFGGWETHAKAGIASGTDEWKTIYNKDLKALSGLSVIAPITASIASECFTETFGCYILHPDRLMKASPDAYAYMEKVVASFE